MTATATRPDQRSTPRQWLRANLFSGPVDSVLTVAFAALLGWLALRVARFVFVSADWEVVRRNLRLFMVGRYPTDELWRVWVGLHLVAAMVGLSFGVASRVAADAALLAGRAPIAARRGASVLRFWPLVAAAVAVVSLTRTVVPGVLLAGVVVALLSARWAGHHLPRSLTRWSWVGMLVGLASTYAVLDAGAGWDEWGGLHLTVFVTVAGVVLAFPLGLVLALGRRSSLPAVRWLSIVYIEAFRGVPLIALLLMGQFMIGFFFPTYLDPPGNLTRALIAIVAFEAAYIAEVVRGGLQAVPRGQYEAAQALGMRPTLVMRLVVLPQALRAVIPGIVGQFISLFKDTSLLSIISFFELLGVAQVVLSQPDFRAQGLDAVTLSFAGFIFWVGCYTMSRESRRIERRLGVGER